MNKKLKIVIVIISFFCSGCISEWKEINWEDINWHYRKHEKYIDVEYKTNPEVAYSTFLRCNNCSEREVIFIKKGISIINILPIKCRRCEVLIEGD